MGPGYTVCLTFLCFFMFLFSRFMFLFCDLVYLINLIWFDIYILLISFVIRNQTRRQALGKYGGFGSNFRPKTICGTQRSAINLATALYGSWYLYNILTLQKGTSTERAPYWATLVGCDMRPPVQTCAQKKKRKKTGKNLLRPTSY